ncbi:MAG: antitoxin [Buchananella hordeovulneris]|nr:antitoxin [Buchananella hordeovulneris]
MNLDDIKGKASELAAKAGDMLPADKVEEVSDKVLDSVASAADKVTGGKFTDKIEAARDAVDKQLGN